MSRYIPPAAPPPALPPVPPALDPPVPPQGDGPGWGAFAAPVLIGAGLGWGAGQALAAGWDAGWVLFWGAVGLGLCVARLLWVSRAYSRARAAQAAYQRALERYWGDSLDARRAAYAGQVAALTQWTGTVLGKAPPGDPGPVLQPQAYFERALAPLAARLDALTAQMQEQEERARVANPVANPAEIIPEQVTNRLDDPLALLTAAYTNGPARRLVEFARQGQSIASRAMAPRWMSDPQWDKATALLSRAGVLVRAGEKQPWRLAPDLPTEAAACHAAVVERLAATCDASELPGDLQA